MRVISLSYYLYAKYVVINNESVVDNMVHAQSFVRIESTDGPDQTKWTNAKKLCARQMHK